MRGCSGSSVAESWAICARSATCCSTSRWMSGELSTSVMLGDRAGLERGADLRGLGLGLGARRRARATARH